MRSFVILSLIAVAYARPDVSLGYNYGPVLDGSSGATFAHESLLSAPITSLIPDGISTHHFLSSPIQHGSLQEPVVTKQFFLHSAPEEHEIEHKHFVLGRPQKNYRVVFIKAPAPASVRLSAEYAPVEEKTQIFVLSQKEAELNVQDIATPAPTQPSKPEVFFIKYKTPEEAIHAQQKIQAQYDSLGGSTQITDEGTAPVSSVIGSLGSDISELSGSSSLSSSVISTLNSATVSEAASAAAASAAAASAAAAVSYLPPTETYLPAVKKH